MSDKFGSVSMDKVTSYSCREWSSRSSGEVADSGLKSQEVAKSLLLFQSIFHNRYFIFLMMANKKQANTKILKKSKQAVSKRTE